MADMKCPAGCGCTEFKVAWDVDENALQCMCVQCEHVFLTRSRFFEGPPPNLNGRPFREVTKEAAERAGARAHVEIRRET